MLRILPPNDLYIYMQVQIYKKNPPWFVIISNIKFHSPGEGLSGGGRLLFDCISQSSCCFIKCLTFQSKRIYLSHLNLPYCSMCRQVGVIAITGRNDNSHRWGLVLCNRICKCKTAYNGRQTERTKTPDGKGRLKLHVQKTFHFLRLPPTPTSSSPGNVLSSGCCKTFQESSLRRYTSNTMWITISYKEKWMCFMPWKPTGVHQNNPQKNTYLAPIRNLDRLWCLYVCLTVTVFSCWWSVKLPNYMWRIDTMV